MSNLSKARLLSSTSLVPFEAGVVVRAHADPISAAIVGAMGIGAGTFGAAVVSFGVNMAFSTAFSILSMKLAGKGQKSGGIASEETTAGESNPHRIVLGRYATGGGAIAPSYAWGKTNDFLVNIIAWADHEIDGVESFIIDGIEHTVGISQANGNKLVGKYEDHAWATNYLGNQTTASPYLIEKFGSHERPWTADHKLKGLAYSVLTFKYNAKKFSGFPEVKAVVRGMKLYDPRKDSTVGGSGTQRWANKATWTFTDNPIVMAYNIMRGITLPNGSVYGLQVSQAALPLDRWFSAMNACDEPMADHASTNVYKDIKRYRAGIEFGVNEAPLDVIATLLNSANGKLSDHGGVFNVTVGGEVMPIAHITDDEVIISESRSESPYKGLSETFNYISGSYPDPSNAWQETAAVPIENPAWVIEDEGRILATEIKLGSVPYAGQVRRIMREAIADHRRQRIHTITLPPSYAGLTPLDVITWTSAGKGYSSKHFEVQHVSIDTQTLNISCNIKEVDPSDYDINAVSDAIAPYLPSRTATNPVVIGVEGFLATYTTIVDGAGNNRRPAIKISWTPSETLQGVAYEIATDPNGVKVASGTHNRADAGEVIVSEGILANQTYRVFARSLIDGFETQWSAYQLVSTGDIRLGLSDLDDPTQQAIEDAALAAQTIEVSLGAIESGVTAAQDAANLAAAARDAANVSVTLVTNMRNQVNALSIAANTNAILSAQSAQLSANLVNQATAQADLARQHMMNSESFSLASSLSANSASAAFANAEAAAIRSGNSANLSASHSAAAAASAQSAIAASNSSAAFAGIAQTHVMTANAHVANSRYWANASQVASNTATAQANLSSASALAAANSASQASANSASARGFRDEAFAAQQNASSFASQASLSSGLAVEARDMTIVLRNQSETLPYDFRDGLVNWTSSFTGQKPTQAPSHTNITLIENDPDFGQAAELAMSGTTGSLAHRGHLKADVNAVYRLTVKFKVMSGNVRPVFYLRRQASDYANIGPNTVIAANTYTEGQVVTITKTIAGVNGSDIDVHTSLIASAGWLRCYVSPASGATETGTIRIAEMKFENITSEVRSARSAAAASNSAEFAFAQVNAIASQSGIVQEYMLSANASAVAALNALGQSNTLLANTRYWANVSIQASNSALASANTSGASALAAANSASQASTNAASAKGYRDEAYAARDSANSSAAAASLASGVAVESKDFTLGGILSSTLTIPKIGTAPQFLTSSREGDPKTIGGTFASNLVVADEVFGQALDWTSNSHGGNVLLKQVFPWGDGQVYKVKLRFRVLSSTHSDGLATLAIQGIFLDDAFANGGVFATGNTNVSSDGLEVTIEGMFSNVGREGHTIAVYSTTGRKWVRFGYRNNRSGQTINVRVVDIEVTDVTSVIDSRVAASAASGFASNAEVFSNTAGQFATAAIGAASAANTARANASTFASQSSSARDESRDYANAAAQSSASATQAQGLAVSARDQAISIANRTPSVLPHMIDPNLLNWTSTHTGISPENATAVLRLTPVVDAQMGQSVDIDTSANGHALAPRGSLPWSTGRIYRATFRYKVMSGSPVVGMLLRRLNASYGNLGPTTIANRSSHSLNTVYETSFVMSDVAQSGVDYVFTDTTDVAFIKVFIGGTNTNVGVIRVGMLKFEDITETFNSEKAATAASLSMTNALAGANTSAYWAGIAEGHMIAANTARANASSFASSAAAVLSNVTSLSSQVSSQSGIVANTLSDIQVMLNSTPAMLAPSPLAANKAFGTNTTGLPNVYTPTGDSNYDLDGTYGPYVRRSTTGSGGIYLRSLAPATENAVYRVTIKVRANNDLSLRVRSAFIRPDGTGITTSTSAVGDFTPSQGIVTVQVVFGRRSGGLVSATGGNVAQWTEALGIRFGIDNVSTGSAISFDVFEMRIDDITQADWASRDSASANASAAAASLSESNAFVHANTSLTHALASNTAKTLAETARANASTFMTQAATARDQAQNAAANAALSMGAAAQSALLSSQSAGQASNSASLSLAHANTASGHAASANSSAATALEYRNSAARIFAGGAVKNPIFTDWTGTYPNNISVVLGGGSVSKVIASAKYVNAIRLNSVAGSTGPSLYAYGASGHHEASGSPYAVMTNIEISLNSVISNFASWTGRISFAWVDNGTERWTINYLRDLIENKTGFVQTIRIPVNRPSSWVGSGTQNFTFRLYSGDEAANFTVHRFDFEEALMNSFTDIVQRSVATTDNMSSAIIMRAISGNTAAGLELVSVSNVNGGSKSTAKIAANNIILDGSVLARHIEANTINATHLSTGTLITNAAQIGNGTITNAKISGSISSNNYVSGSAGWMIDKGGNAQFNNLVVRNSLVVGSVSDIVQHSLPSEYVYSGALTQRLLIELGPIDIGEFWQVHASCRFRAFQVQSTTGKDQNPTISPNPLFVRIERRVQVDGGSWSAWTNLYDISSGTTLNWVNYMYNTTVAGEYTNVQFRMTTQGSSSATAMAGSSTSIRKLNLIATKVTR